MSTLVVNGSELQRLRSKKQSRQIDVAAAADVSIARLRSLERGGQNARLTTVVQLADYFNVDPRTLLLWVND